MRDVCSGNLQRLFAKFCWLPFYCLQFLSDVANPLCCAVLNDWQCQGAAAASVVSKFKDSSFRKVCNEWDSCFPEVSSSNLKDATFAYKVRSEFPIFCFSDPLLLQLPPSRTVIAIIVRISQDTFPLCAVDLLPSRNDDTIWLKLPVIWILTTQHIHTEFRHG